MQTLKTSKAKENILKKVRDGLKETLPMPFPDAEKKPVADLYYKAEHSLEETFAEAFIKLGGKFAFCMDEAEASATISSLFEERGWKQMLCADNDWLHRLNGIKPIAMAANPSIESAEVCITTCEYLVARTGSFLLTSKQNLGRTSPVFYPVHIVIAYASQIIADLPEVITKLTSRYNVENLPSMINLNTGPSRTADIEKTLVVGVHGPGEVFCFLLP